MGGVSMLSGYVNKVRHEEENVLYAISGDMFRGSVIASEYRGISTIEIMNMLSPDVVTLGNHEVDYGVAHLLFIEKCAKFPIINANMYLTCNQVRLFRSHIIKEIGGMKMLFIGILTDEVGKICNAYQTEDIDFIVLLTHIGFEADQELVSLSLNGYEIRDSNQYTLGLQSFHLKNMEKFLDVSLEEVTANKRPKVISTRSTDVLEEFFSQHELIRASNEQRLIQHGSPDRGGSRGKSLYESTLCPKEPTGMIF